MVNILLFGINGLIYSQSELKIDDKTATVVEGARVHQMWSVAKSLPLLPLLSSCHV